MCFLTPQCISSVRKRKYHLKAFLGDASTLLHIYHHFECNPHGEAKKLGWQAYLDGRGILGEEERRI
jgi:hypothetical protein